MFMSILFVEKNIKFQIIAIKFDNKIDISTNYLIYFKYTSNIDQT